MSEKAKRLLLNIGFFLITVGVVVYTQWPIFRPKPADNLTCHFSAESTKNQYSFGGLQQPIEDISLSGFIDDPFDEVLYDFNGDAVVQTNTTTIDVSARGSVFIDGSGQPIGVLLILTDERFGQDWLHISTLNSDGVADYSKSQAFLYSGQARGDPFRLSYPVNMKCTATLEK